VRTFSYYRPPQVSPNGQLVMFDAEVYSAADGSEIELQLDFEPDNFVVGADRQLYLLYESTFVRWSLSGGRAQLAEERVISPHELGTPILAGVFENSEAWFLYRGAFTWFKPDGFPRDVSHVEDGFFSHLIGFDQDGLAIACGRNRGDFRQNALATCVGFSEGYDLPVWNLDLGEILEEIAGGFVFPGGVVVALENGELYVIAYSIEDGE